jgi:hypothetical protein
MSAVFWKWEGRGERTGMRLESLVAVKGGSATGQ